MSWKRRLEPPLFVKNLTAATIKEVVVSLCWPSTQTRVSWFNRNLPIPHEWKSSKLSSSFIPSVRSNLIPPSAILSVPWNLMPNEIIVRMWQSLMSNLDHRLPPAFKLGLFPAVTSLEHRHYHLKAIANLFHRFIFCNLWILRAEQDFPHSFPASCWSYVMQTCEICVCVIIKPWNFTC